MSVIFLWLITGLLFIYILVKRFSPSITLGGIGGVKIPLIPPATGFLLIGVILIAGTILLVVIFWPSYAPFLALVLPIFWYYTASRAKTEAHFWGIKWRDGEQYLSSYLMLQFMFQMLLLVGVILLLLLWGPLFLAKALQGSALYIILGVSIIFTTWFFESWGKFTRMMLYAFGGGVTILWLLGRKLAAQNDFATIELWRSNILELDKLFYL